jgi:hypothetical protein
MAQSGAYSGMASPVKPILEGGRKMETQGPIDQVRVRILPDGRMTREDAARYLGRTPKTLAMWQLQCKGPASVLVGGRRFYYKTELDRFISGGQGR